MKRKIQMTCINNYNESPLQRDVTLAFDKSILISGVFFLLVSMSLDSCIGECSFISIDSLIVIFNTTFLLPKVKTKLFDYINTLGGD